MARKAKAPKTIELNSIDVVGMGLVHMHTEDREALARRSRRGLKSGVSLAADTGNPVDPNAVHVTVDGQPIGFLRKDTAARLRPLLDAGKLEVVEATISDVNVKRGSANVDLKLVDNR